MEGMVNFTLRPFFSWERTPVPIEKEAGWAAENNLNFNQFKIECDLNNTC
jgi:hypothetical protein